MDLPTLTGSQRTRLRGLGQRLDAKLMVGQGGVTASVLAELNRLLDAQELVKLRFLGADRHQRATLAEQLAAGAPCLHVGSVGATALFFRPNSDPDKSRIKL